MELANSPDSCDDLSLLHLEDSDLDADLTAAMLARGGLRVAVRRATTREEFTAALQEGGFNLILSDYALPCFDGAEALEMSRVARPNVPFIFVSGVIGEEFAIESLKRGATDYVLKRKLDRLVPAVRRALAEARERSERQRVEAEWRNGQERLRLASRAARFGTWEWDLRTGLIDCDEVCKANLGLSADANLDQGKLFEAIVAEDRERVRAVFLLALRDNEDFTCEHRILWPDGGVHWLLVRGRLASTGAKLMIGVVLDIDEQKRTEAALREADQRKDRFLAVLAHELRNPLAPLRNGLQILRLADGDAVASAAAREMMERQLGHLVRLVDDLLDVSRIRTDKIELRREPIDLVATLRAAVETARPTIDQSGHTLAVTLPSEPARLLADPIRLTQVFANLLTNAAKYTDRGGRIELNARREDDEFVVSVRDNGIGIPAELLPGVFDLFMQINGLAERSQGGLGIGLTLVRRLVEMHGGTVHASSAGPDRGSEFTVRLPALPLASVPEGSSEADGSLKRFLEAKPFVLVCDDNFDVADSMAMLLRLSGADVQVVHDGTAALAAAAAAPPDVVLLDLGMPGMTGYEVARQLRQRSELASTVLVALTGWGSEETRARCREVGFHHHLTKPADLATLRGIVASVAERRRREEAAIGLTSRM